MRMRRARGLLLGISLAAGAGGCVGWRTESVSPRELLRGARDGQQLPAVRITKPDQTKVEIWSPTLAGDSIAGHPTERAIARFAIPLSSVQAIETRHTSLGRTLLAVLAVGGGIAAYAFLQSLNQY